MGNHSSNEAWFQRQRARGHHECEILGRGLEGTESSTRWNNCEKNPGHNKFIPVQDLQDEHLPRSLDEDQRERLTAFMDLTVRIRVQWTSSDRPDDDDLSEYRGTDTLRLGTGFIYDVSKPESNKPCHCNECDRKVSRKQWLFYVTTAHHVVYNTEEARKTRVDLFYDDESCLRDGRMKTVWAVEVIQSYSNTDVCEILCVTHDEALAERIHSINRYRRSLHDWYQHSLSRPARFPLDTSREVLAQLMYDHVVVISHPHGQPKKITVGKMTGRQIMHDGFLAALQYNTATCSGSSGAPIFPFYTNLWTLFPYMLFIPQRAYSWSGSLHNGTHSKTSLFWNQVNYGIKWHNS